MPPLSTRTLLRVFYPLALSWLMMSADSPVCTRYVNMLPDNRVQIGGFLVLFALSLFIESPVIDLLATSTTLSGSRQNFAAIRRFTVWLMVWTGGVHFLIAATPLFDLVVGGLLGQSPEVVAAVRLPLLVLVPWSPAIGWRRHVQGLLIRNGMTGPIGLGTVVRLCTLVSAGGVAYLSHRLPGALVAATAMSTSVIAEALYIHFAGKRALAKVAWPEGGEELTARRLLAFHVPLSLSTMVMLTSMPMTSRALAQAPDSLLAMNAWQVSVTLAFLLRTVTFALPEVVIANWRPGTEARLLTRFCMGIGLSLSALMLLMAATGVDTAFFRSVTGADATVSEGAHAAFLACSLLPTLTAATSYLKGVLTSLHVTSTRLWGSIGSAAVLATALVVGVGLRWPGVVAASVAVTASQATEALVLLAFVRRRVGARAFSANPQKT